MSEATLPDGLLLRRYRESRDEHAFAEIHRRHGRLVLAACRRETGDPALAEDAAQAVFLLVIRKSFDDQASLAGWLHGASRLVSRNLVREEGRRRRRERRAFEEFGQAGDAAWNAVSPHIDAALGGLGAGDREAVLLRFASDLSLAEVGRALGIGENAARMRVSRALERMRGHLRRAGVGVGVLLLASLLSTRLADAEAGILASASVRARRLAQGGLRPVPLPLGLGLGLGPGLGLGLGGAALAIVAGVGLRAASLGPPRLSTVESTRLFQSASGEWRGTLEFVDDATGARTKTPTTVESTAPDGGLRLVARYPRFSNVDATTFMPQAGGHYRIETGGPASSHRLDGLYDLVRARDGTPTFEGFSPAARGDVRLSLRVAPRSLSVREEIRKGGEFRLRNRFELTKAP